MGGILLALNSVRPALTLSQTDSTPSGNDSDFAPCGAVTSNVNTVSVTGGGSGTYTYLWERTSSADGNPFNATASTSASTAWSATRCDADSDNTEGWKCTVTDTVFNKTATISCTVSLTWANLS